MIVFVVTGHHFHDCVRGHHHHDCVRGHIYGHSNDCVRGCVYVMFMVIIVFVVVFLYSSYNKIFHDTEMLLDVFFAVCMVQCDIIICNMQRRNLDYSETRRIYRVNYGIAWIFFFTSFWHT